MNDRIRRLVLGSVAALQAGAALGFLAQSGLAPVLWPWPARPLSMIFLGAGLAAFATGAGWTALTGRWNAALPALISVAAVMALLGIAFWWGHAPMVWPMVCALTAAGAALLAWDAARQTGRGKRLAPWLRLTCAGFASLLVMAGIALNLGAPHVFPWPLDPVTSGAFGAIFLGLSLAYGLSALWADRDMARVAMLGFLVYDLALLPPFLRHFGAVAPQHLPSLEAYIAVLAASALVALAILRQDMTDRR